MTLQEILTMINLKYPHPYANADIITMVNETQKRIFRTLYKPKTATTYDVLAGNPFYPVNFSPESIIDVVVDDEEYPYQDIQYDAQGCFYYIEDGNTIGIYPTPTEDIINGLTVFHYKEPATLSDLSASPELDSAWHMMLVYHTCRELAVMARDNEGSGGMVNVFVAEINDLEKQFNRSKQAKPHRIQDVYGVGRGAR